MSCVCVYMRECGLVQKWKKPSILSTRHVHNATNDIIWYNYVYGYIQ